MTPNKPTALVVDDRPNMLKLMAKVLGPTMAVRTAGSGGDAVALLKREHVDAVLCDLKMPDMSGIEVLRACKHARPGAAFVVMTAYATVATAVEALRLGAYDYITKPFEPGEARAILHRAVGLGQAFDAAATDALLPGLIGSSRPMVDVAELVRRVADSHITTLVLGETGTGKERIARAVHLLGPRASERFVALNCAALPAELLESELFGHARGAFTGAAQHHAGLFEAANQGTLFLDEIGDMPPILQAKLTRVLEERAVRRVGESTERNVNVRLIAATHRDLQGMVADGTFREDLWYRLNVATIVLPPLRDRPGDVELLARHFFDEHKKHSGHPLPHGFSRDALDAMRSYHWPGNVRQVRSVVDQACVIAQGERIVRADLPPDIAGATDAEPPAWASLSWAEALDRGREDAAQQYLMALLEHFDGNVADAAARAGVERESFYRLCRKHGLHPAAFRPGR